MHIVFYGQLGLPHLNNSDHDAAENRVAALSRHLVQDGHEVTVFGTPPYLSSGNYFGIKLKRLPSLNPQKPGGWLYLILGLFSLIYSRPDVIHVHDWRAALLLSLTRWFFKDTRLLWTVDSLPPTKIAAASYQLSATTTTPSRIIQYRLLTEYGLRARYIPDGYNEPAVSTIALKRLALKKDHYCVALVSSPRAARRLKKAYKASQMRLKLIILRQETPRLRRTLIHNAALVLLGDQSVVSHTLLGAMRSQRAIIAPTYSFYQELLGTTGQYYAPRDAAGLTQAIINVAAVSDVQKKWGQAAAKRARRHFTWSRIFAEYDILYAPQIRAVPLDSIQVRPRVQYS